MLLTLLKVVFFFGVVLAAALGAMHLAETGQPLMIQFNGTEYTLGPVQTAIAALIALFGAWLIVQLLRLALAFLRFLAGDRTAIDRYFDRSRERKGYQALAEGMLAVASGEGKLAQDKAVKAAKYLDQPHLTNLLAAQAAETAGDAPRAESVYRDMLADNRTRFVGVRGLMQQRMAQGDTATALKLAEKAYALKPSHAQLQDTLLMLQTREHDWKGARSTLKDKRKQGVLPQGVHLRRDAVLALQEASEVLAQGNSISAREAAISANRASPDLVPAAVLAARSYLAQKDTRNASRLLQKAWDAQPHPALAAAYAEIVPDETPAQRLRRFDDLIRQKPDHEESRLLKAELALAAEDFPAARRALGDLAETRPTTRSLAIMAAVERGEGADDSVVRGWLARAMNASRGPQWVCDNCHNIMADWSPVCDSCHGFDTLTWREPPMAARSAGAGNGVEMLPLIVGRPASAAAHVERTFTEADAYAEGTDAPRHLPAPARDRDAADAPVAPQVAGPAPASGRHADVSGYQTPSVAPGMVPRESDYADSRRRPAAVVTPPVAARGAPTSRSDAAEVIRPAVTPTDATAVAARPVAADAVAGARQSMASSPAKPTDSAIRVSSDTAEDNDAPSLTVTHLEPRPSLLRRAFGDRSAPPKAVAKSVDASRAGAADKTSTTPRAGDQTHGGTTTAADVSRTQADTSLAARADIAGSANPDDAGSAAENLAVRDDVPLRLGGAEATVRGEAVRAGSGQAGSDQTQHAHTQPGGVDAAARHDAARPDHLRHGDAASAPTSPGQPVTVRQSVADDMMGNPPVRPDVEPLSDEETR